MTIRSIWNMRVVATSALVLVGLLVTGLTPTTQGQASGTFTATGSMNFARRGHLAVLLNSGQVLVVTGVVGATEFGDFNTAELYNPSNGKWTLTGSTSARHETGTATLLSNGEVLLAGGGTGNFDSTRCSAVAELYDPKNGQWSDTGSMNAARCAPTTTLLPNGEVLVAGGSDPDGNSLGTAELYNPVTGTWQETGSLNTSRIGPLAELLGNGTVLVAGGSNVTGSSSGICALEGGCKFTQLTSAEIFNPFQGRWATTGSMPATGGSGSLLANGDVLKFFNSFYTPATGTWTAAGAFPFNRAGDSTATLLGNGLVLATGFLWKYYGTGDPPVSDAYLYNFSTNGYTHTGPMTISRFEDTATLLPNGQVLVAGGETHNSRGTTTTASAELYTP